MKEQLDPVKENEYAAFIAIDWADKEHEVCLLAAVGQQREYSVLEQKPEAITAWTTRLRERFSAGKIAVGVEQSRGPLIYALMGYEFIDIYPINPATLGRYRSAFSPSGAKDDRRDVDYIMDILTTHREQLLLWRADDENTRSLRIYAEERRKTVDASKALANRIRALLKGFYPQALELIGDDLTSPMALAFLRRWPSLQKLSKAQKTTLQNFYYQKGSRSAQLIQERLELIEEAVPLTRDKVIVATSETILLEYLNQLHALNRAIAQYEKQLKKLFSKHPHAEIYASLPGAGEALAPRLAAVMGTDSERFKTAKNIQQYSGTAPVVKSSGTAKGKPTKLLRKERKQQGSRVVVRRRSYPKFVLQTFHEFARCSIPYCVWAKAYFEQRQQKGAGKHQAIRALAFKWQRIIFRCWKDNKPYDEQTYIKSLRTRGSKLIPLIDEIMTLKECA